MTRRLAVLDAPSNFGLQPVLADCVPCAHHMAYAIRQRDLVTRLGARDAGQVEPPVDAHGPEAPAELCRSNCDGRAILAFTEALAERVSELVRAREFPVVLGGDCSILLGNLLGLRSLGRYGLVFVDSHGCGSSSCDLDREGGLLTAAGLDLAIATGCGPAALTNLRGLRPYVDERHVVLFEMGSEEGAGEGAAASFGCGVEQELRSAKAGVLGAREAAEHSLRYLEEQSLDGFWIHLDADVLDPPAGAAGGGEAFYDELSAALEVFLGSQKAVGLELTIHDPELDPDGESGDRLVDAVVRAFGSRPPAVG
ncbi:MAG TPA: arginase family protein [Kofleriaceae bacterium]|nr:arginase family protein [Kofleriaceae bacterium]